MLWKGLCNNWPSKRTVIATVLNRERRLGFALDRDGVRPAGRAGACVYPARAASVAMTSSRHLHQSAMAMSLHLSTSRSPCVPPSTSTRHIPRLCRLLGSLDGQEANDLMEIPRSDPRGLLGPQPEPYDGSYFSHHQNVVVLLLSIQRDKAQQPLKKISENATGHRWLTWILKLLRKCPNSPGKLHDPRRCRSCLPWGPEGPGSVVPMTRAVFVGWRSKGTDVPCLSSDFIQRRIQRFIVP